MTKKTPQKITITGEISAIRFRNSEGWAVFSLQGQAMGFTGTIADMVDIGTEVTVTGVEEVTNFGKQLKCEKIVPAAPDVSTEKGVIKLLQRLPGIGPKKAAQAIQQFGHEEAWNLAMTDPEKIGVKAEDVHFAKIEASSLLESYETMVYLLGLGLTDHQAGVISRHYGRSTIKVVSEFPYQMTEIDGMGFITVDKIALKAGISVGNTARIAACILYVLHDSATNGGNIWHNGWSLADIVQDILTQTAMKAEVPMAGAPNIEDIRKQVHFLAAEEKVVVRQGRVFSKSLLDAEVKILKFVGAAHA
jgi:exodeoxyribonuclease V alpha subunit